jgi:serine/threonine protein kinase
MQTTVLPINNTEPINSELNSYNGLLSIGESLNSYIIKSKVISDSGEAEIYLCEKDNQTYVLKYYFNCKPKTEVIEKLKNIRNPDIVSLYEFGEYNGHFYEIMEYAEGGSLDSKDSDGKYKYLPVNEETAIQIVRETVNAFNECHKAGIIHRDIKPGNLFYKNKDGSDILVGDFGISSYYDVEDGMSKHLTQTSARTEGYTAPEVYSGVIGPEIDYYSLGVTLWELLTAKDPFMTLEGKPMFASSIMLETIQGKMADMLIARSPDLSHKMKTLIRGLMTVRHEKRWNYESVIKFLDGEEVPVYTESNQIPLVKIGETECTSYKEIAAALLSDLKAGKNFVYKGELGRYLVKIDRKFAEKISDEIDELSAKGDLDEGLFTIAYRLCPNLEFKLSEKTSFSSLSELINILETKPKEIMPYLLDESKNLYRYLKAIGLGTAADGIWKIAKGTDSDYLIIPKVVLALNGNSIAPFADGVNDKIVLSDLSQIHKLSAALQKRLLLKIDAYDRSVCAWFENLAGVDIGEWRRSVSAICYLDEERKLTKWELFNLFIDEKYTPASGMVDEEKFLEGLKFFNENQNQQTLNLIVDRTWGALFDRGCYKVCSDMFDLLSENTDGLKHDLEFYKAKKGLCLYKLGEYQDALSVFEKIKDVLGDSFKYNYCALTAHNLNKNELALDYVDKALVQKAEAGIFNLKGKILFNLKRYEEAVTSFSMALEIKKLREFYLNRAKCYDRLAKNGAPDLKKKAEADRECAADATLARYSSEFEKLKC